MPQVEELLEDLAKSRIEVWEEGGILKYRAPSETLCPEVRGRLVESRGELLAHFQKRQGREEGSTTLPLTDLQRAYWLAEREPEGATAGYWYEEYEAAQMDVSRLELAFRRLVRRHEALRVVFDDDGRQRVLEDPGSFRVAREDLRRLPRAEVESRIAAARARFGTVRAGLENWPLLDVLVQELEESFRVHIGGRFIVLDGFAWDQLCEELAAVYCDSSVELSALQQSYAGAVREGEAERGTLAYQESLAWWLERKLPDAPQLAIRRDFSATAPRRFSRLRATVAAADCERLRAHASRRHLTLNGVLCAAYAEVIEKWSVAPNFTLNLLLTNPRHLRSGGRWPLSNAATTLLLEVDGRPGGSFGAKAQRLKARLASDLQHSRVSGIAVGRERALRRGVPAVPNPVVFASTLGMGREDGSVYGLERMGWRPLGGYVQTPHVLLDQQVFQRGGELVLNWDFVADAFEPGVSSAMFDAYCELLLRLARDESFFEVERPVNLPRMQREVRSRVNANLAAARPGRLDDFLGEVREQAGDAIIDERRRWTYREVEGRAGAVAAELRRRGVGRGDVVPVIARKGALQVIGALGVMASGAAYVPLELDAPRKRLENVLGCLEPPLVLCDAEGEPLVGERIPCVVLDGIRDTAPRVPAAGAADDLAYVIFTSGSTGQPKGVEISHRAARNTIDDVLGRWPLGADDAVLAVSRFSFDLSVFDYFGVLRAGGRVVMPGPEHSRDPAYWCERIRDERVTVWNSVPALAEMLVDYAELHELQLPLRLVLLSGDWIPKTLPQRVRGVAPLAQVISLGGATEASIWSNYYDTRSLDPEWPSVPYGFPLGRQGLHVLDERLRDRPDYVEGDLYISGAGLARGYWKDPERSAASFLAHPESGERIYRTGDRARYRDGGVVEFLGRRDTQVKIRGHRIELGEVEAALVAFGGVRAAVALVTGGPRLLSACVVADFAIEAEKEALQKHLRALLPEYMVPVAVRRIDEIPLTVNGKVDRDALTHLFADDVPAKRVRAAPASTLEREIHATWQSVLGHDNFGRGESFFEIGGDSLAAARMVNELEVKLGRRLPMAAVMSRPTVAELATALEGEPLEESSLVHCFGGDAGELVCCLHPIGGTLFGYRALAERLVDSARVIGIAANGTSFSRPDTSVLAMAERYRKLLSVERSKARTLVLVGWSFGGIIACELARLLANEAGRVSLIVVDPWVRVGSGIELDDARLRADFARDANSGGEPSKALERLFEVYSANVRALLAYDAPKRVPSCDLVVATRTGQEPGTALQPILNSPEWRLDARTHEIDADHYTIMLPPKVDELAAVVRARLAVEV